MSWQQSFNPDERATGIATGIQPTAQVPATESFNPDERATGIATADQHVDTDGNAYQSFNPDERATGIATDSPRCVSDMGRNVSIPTSGRQGLRLAQNQNNLHQGQIRNVSIPTSGRQGLRPVQGRG